MLSHHKKPKGNLGGKQKKQHPKTLYGEPQLSKGRLSLNTMKVKVAAAANADNSSDMQQYDGALTDSDQPFNPQ